MGVESVKESTISNNVKQYIDEQFVFDKTSVVKTSYSRDLMTINVALIGEFVPEDKIKEIEKKASLYSLDDYTIQVTQTALEQGMSEKEIRKLLEQQEQANSSKQETNKVLQEAQIAAKQLRYKTVDELMLLYPQVKSCGFSEMRNKDGKTVSELILVVDELMEDSKIEIISKWVRSKFDMNEDDLAIVQVKSSSLKRLSADDK